MTVRPGHATRTKLEEAVCGEMAHQGIVHAHRSLHFRVQDSAGGTAKYSPAIVAHRGPILFLVEPVPSAGWRTTERLIHFLEQHSPEIVLVVVAPDAAVRKVPPSAYDEIYAASDIARMAQRIREQDPEGLVRPFAKPRAQAGEMSDAPG